MRAALFPAARRAAEMAIRGRTVGEIATFMRVKPTTVTSYLGTARRSGLNVPKAKPGPVAKTGLSTIRVSTDLVAKLRPHAVARHMNVSELAAQLLAGIAEDGLVDAILDDEEDALD